MYQTIFNRCDASIFPNVVLRMVSRIVRAESSISRGEALLADNSTHPDTLT